MICDSVVNRVVILQSRIVFGRYRYDSTWCNFFPFFYMQISQLNCLIIQTVYLIDNENHIDFFSVIKSNGNLQIFLIVWSILRRDAGNFLRKVSKISNNFFIHFFHYLNFTCHRMEVKKFDIVLKNGVLSVPVLNDVPQSLIQQIFRLVDAGAFPVASRANNVCKFWSCVLN